MLLLNHSIGHRAPLDVSDANLLSCEAAREVERFLRRRDGYKVTPLVSLPCLAREIGVGAIQLKDEGHRFGLGSFKALGGSYAVIRLVLEETTRRFGRPTDIAEIHRPEVKALAEAVTVSCARDGNHGRSVAQGAHLVGANCAVFVHSGVSDVLPPSPGLARGYSASMATMMTPWPKLRELPRTMVGRPYPIRPGQATSVSPVW